MSADKKTWRDIMEPNIRKFEVAAFTGNSTTYNAVGSAAMAKLLKEMCRIIDDEIERRSAI